MCCSLKLNRGLDRILSIENYYSSSTEAISVENYEIRFSRFDYMHILEYLCRVSFLTTQNIYRDYFKGHHKVVAIVITCILRPETKIALVHLSFCRSYYVFTPRVLWPWSFLIFIIDELENLAANNASQVGVLVTY